MWISVACKEELNSESRALSWANMTSFCTRRPVNGGRTDRDLSHPQTFCCLGNTYKVTYSYVEIKCQLDATEVFIADLIACSTCFGHHHAHHQVLKSIIQWLLRVVNQHPANRTHNPQLHTRPATWKTTAKNTTRSNHCIILLSTWWWAWWCPKHVEQAIRSAIKTSVVSSWHFISTY